MGGDARNPMHKGLANRRDGSLHERLMMDLFLSDAIVDHVMSDLMRVRVLNISEVDRFLSYRKIDRFLSY
jgi:hypothetical protein